MLKTFSVALAMSLLVSSGAAQAYDLPKLKPDKKISASAEQQKGSVLKSDWTSAELFEEKIKARLASGEKLSPADSARMAADKNYIFVAFYNGAPFFLDKYSIKVKENSDGVKIWEQKIFPISKNYSPRNAKATTQRFCFVNGKIFNLKKEKDALAELANETDRIFLEECFKVGYYFAFGEEAQEN